MPIKYFKTLIINDLKIVFIVYLFFIIKIMRKNTTRKVILVHLARCF